MAVCPQCGRENSDGLLNCGKCGAPFPPLGTPQSSPYYPASAATAPSYPYQSAPVAAYGAVGASGGAASRNNNRNIIIALASALVIVLVLTLGGLFYYKNTSKVSGITADYDALRNKLSNSHGNYNFEIVSSDVSQYPKVRLYISLTDSDNNELTLKSPTAAIKEKIAGGKAINREIKKLERIKDNQGVGYEVLLDKSASMSGDLGEMQNAMRDFVNTLDYKVGDKAELMTFDTYLMYMSTITGDKNRLLTGISNITADGDTALYDALYEGVNNAGNRTGANCVIAFTDGIENSSSHSLDEVISLATEKAVPIYLIGSAEADLATLQRIADQTKGYLWDIDSISDMGEVLNKINSRQKSLYTIEYISDNTADPYVERTISALLADSDDYSVGAIKDEVSFKPVKRSGIEKHQSRYEVFKEDKTWTESNKSCMSKGGHLVTVTSKQEEEQVISLVEAKGIQFAWMGGYTSQRNDGVFAHWVTGEEWSYQNWFPGEPSHTDLDGVPEFYLILWNIKGKWSWNDERDDIFSVPDSVMRMRGKVGYVCEYEQ